MYVYFVCKRFLHIQPANPPVEWRGWLEVVEGSRLVLWLASDGLGSVCGRLGVGLGNLEGFNWAFWEHPARPVERF